MGKQSMAAKETIIHVFWDRVRTMPERPAILHKVSGAYRPVIWREHGRVVELACGGLMHCGLKKDDKVAIVSQSRPHWTWADIAILSAGGVTVPVYPTLGAPEMEYLLNHSQSVCVFLENEKQLAKLASLKKVPETLKFAVLFSGTPNVTIPGVKIMKWEDLLKDGEVYLPLHKDAVSNSVAALNCEDLASIVYTSGTTGVPKGVMLLHRNIYMVCQAMSAKVGFRSDDVCLSFLPLSHVYERVGGQFLSIYEGLLLAYAESIEAVAQNLLEVRPTVLNGVPRFFEKVCGRIQHEIRNNLPKPQQYIIRWALGIGKRAIKLREQATSAESDELIAKIYRAELRVAERLVFSKIRNRFGGHIRFMASGSAPLSPEVQLFFEAIGLPIIEGYGLTETAAPITCNTPQWRKRGTVGRALPGCEVKLAADGEIMVKGPNVFVGYYRDPKSTEAAFKDGWFCTGDIGAFDADGFLSIKDRKKDIIITAGGKHVAPQYLENLFVGDGLISHILVYGDKRKYITALITLNPDGVAAFAKNNGISYQSISELNNHPLMIKELQQIVAQKNQGLASFEQIKKFLVLDRDFSIENDELTPTLKVKRKVITEKYKTMLDDLYEREDLQLLEDAKY